MQKKTQEVFIDYQIIAFQLVVVNTRFYWERILVFVCQYVNRQSQDFRYYWNRVFRADFPSECSNNMTKILPCTFMHCFGTFNMFTVHMCADIGLFGHLSNPVFCSLQFEKKKNLWVSSIFSKCYIFYVDSENPEKNWENICWFWDSSIWIGSVKQSLLLREHTCHRVSIC